MGKIAIIQANLRGFDLPKPPVKQDIETTYHCWTDEDFPPIVSMDGRLQYRIAKTHGWQMLPNYDFYIWLDGSVSLQRPDCATWYLSQLGDNDIGFFAHPHRQTIKEEVEHIDAYLNRTKGTKRGQDYMLRRYEGGLHWDQLMLYPEDAPVYASTVFIYRNTPKVQEALKDWWYYGSRYFTCDQVNLTYVLQKHHLSVRVFDEPLYKSGYMSLVSHHQ